MNDFQEEELLEINTLELNEYTVTFDLNGGMYNGDTSNIVILCDENSFITKPNEDLLERDNCSFVSWKTLGGDSWNFEEDIITEDILLRAEWNWDETHPIYYNRTYSDVEDYFQSKYYGSTNYWKNFSKSIKNVCGKYPVED